jgi:leucine dehydrogenase
MSNISYKTIQHRHADSLFHYAELLGFGELHIKIDQDVGMKAVIAVHNLNRGPAIGGCRLVHYDHFDDAIVDAMRLGQMMTYKAAICDLPHGGAKAVIMRPKEIKDRQAFFSAFGDFIELQNGRYITAVDSGTEASDMDIIATRTRYVTCTTTGGYAGDPSPFTAFGVRRGIEAAVKFKLGRDSLKDIHVVIQGAGHMGYYLTKELTQLGAKVTITDTRPEALEKVQKDFGAKIIAPDEVFDVACDVFAPCALGAILTLETIAKLKCPIVAGSANNQLDHHLHAQALHERDILYAPDFVINSGGLIHVSAIYQHGDSKKAHQQIAGLYDTLMSLFKRGAAENCSTNEVAEIIALEKIKETVVKKNGAKI